MRYLTITYHNKLLGKTDEVVDIVKNLKTTTLQTANVILDFKEQKVIKCSLGGTNVYKDWQRIRDFYYQHYSKIIDPLEKVYTHITHEKQ